MLEKYLQEPDLLTDEEIQEFLTRIFSLSGVERTLEVFFGYGKRKNTGRKPLNLFSAQLYTSKTGAIAFFEES